MIHEQYTVSTVECAVNAKPLQVGWILASANAAQCFASICRGLGDTGVEVQPVRRLLDYKSS